MNESDRTLAHVVKDGLVDWRKIDGLIAEHALGWHREIVPPDGKGRFLTDGVYWRGG